MQINFSYRIPRVWTLYYDELRLYKKIIWTSCSLSPKLAPWRLRNVLMRFIMNYIK